MPLTVRRFTDRSTQYGLRTEMKYPPGSPEQRSAQSASYTWDDSFNGVSNPKWREQIMRGINATTTASGEKQFHRFPTGSASITVKTPVTGGFSETTTSVSGAIDRSPPIASNPVGLDVTSCETEARLKFHSKIREARSSFQGGVFFGELREAIRMLRHPAQSLRRGIDDYFGSVKERTRRLSSNARSKVIGQTWLEYSYGWRPLVNDIEGAYLQLHAMPVRYLKRCSGFAKVNAAMGGVMSPSGQLNCTYKVPYKRESWVSVRYIGAVDAEFHKPPNQLESWGLSTQDFFPTMWNLIPYSFLVDYFTNIGTLIEGMSSGAASLAWGCRTTRKWSTSSTMGSIGGFPTGTGILDTHGSCSPQMVSRWTRFERIPIFVVSTGVSDFSFKIPGSSTKWLNIGALARVKLR